MASAVVLSVERWLVSMLATCAELSKVTANDLTLLNDVPPWSVPIHLDRGAATLSGHFHFNTGSWLGSALLDLDVTHLSLQNKSAHLQDGVRLQRRSKSFGLNSVRLAPDGSWLALDDFAIHYTTTIRSTGRVASN